MFEDLRRAWAEAVRNFRRELAETEGADPGQRVDDPGGDALARARARLRELEIEANEMRERAAREREEESVCRRRHELAERIGDVETVRIAARFAARHGEWADVLERKLQVVTEEMNLLRRELRELEALLRHASPTEPGGGRPAGEPGSVSGRSGPSRRGARRPRGGDPSADPLHDPIDEAFRELEEEARSRAAEERVSRMKRDR